MNIKKSIKKIVVSSRIACLLSRYVTSNMPRIIMYHRFAENGQGDIFGSLEKDVFEWQLGIIKKDFVAMSLSEYLEKKESSKMSGPAVVITIDDAYLDFYLIAYPLLLEKNMPATLFPATEFLGGAQWFWWDRLKYILATCESAEEIKFRYEEIVFKINTKTPSGRKKAWNDLSAYMIRLPPVKRKPLIDSLSLLMNVEMPLKPVYPYKIMDWEDIKQVSVNNIEMGSHTLSHPVLSHLDAKTLSKEVQLSKAILEKKTGLKIKAFGYPHGMPTDYNVNVIDAVKKAGYIGAVVAHDKVQGLNGIYAIRRFCVSADRADFLWKLYGMEMIVRNMGRLLNKILKKA